MSLHALQRWHKSVETATLYAAFNDETQETLLGWSEGQPNTTNTIRFLEALLDHYGAQGTEVVVLLWDHADWHISRTTPAWLKACTQQAKQQDPARVLVCYLPKRSPRLMELEAVSGWTRHEVLRPRVFAGLDEFNQSVETSRLVSQEHSTVEAAMTQFG